MDCDVSRIVMNDGHTLLVRMYSPAGKRASRTLVVVHGACEHGQRYERVAHFLVERGWNVIVADQRGHGLSDGVPTHVDDFHQYVDDLASVCAYYRCDPRRTALLGHSMGGLVSIRFAQSLRNRVSAMVLMSPLLAIKLEFPWFLRLVDRWFARVLKAFMPRLRFYSRIDASCTTRCRLALEQKRHDKLLHNSVTIGWYLAVQRTLKRAWKESPGLDLPLLVIQSERDCIVDPAAPEIWINHVSSGDKTLRFIPGALHELFSEPDWQQIATFISRWLEKRLPVQEVQTAADEMLESTITPPSWLRALNAQPAAAEEARA